MTIGRIDPARDQIPDLLTRPPSGSREFVMEWSHLMVDPVRQIEALADLFAMGLLSREEFELYKAQITAM